MRRWHEDLPVMRRRLNLEKMLHASFNERYEDCHCYEKRGWYRKRRPLGNQRKHWILKIGQWEKKQRNKRQRRMRVEEVA